MISPAKISVIEPRSSHGSTLISFLYCNTYVGGMCNFLGFESPQQRFEAVDQYYSLVTTQFYSTSKGQYTLEALGQADPKGETSICLGFLLLYVCLLPALSLPYANWAGQEGGVFVSHEVIILVHWYSCVAFSLAFSFLCLIPTAILNSFLLF